MALNGKYVSFQYIVETVYRRAGYQTIDWADAVEVVGETIRRIGALPAYKNITTNGTDSNPLEVADYRVALPSNFISLEAVRRITLDEDEDGNLSITSFAPMIESTDLYYKSVRETWTDTVGAGTYDYNEFKQLDTITLTGESGMATIGGPLTKNITFDTDLTTTASNFVTTNLFAYDAEGIVISSDDEDISFLSKVSGTSFISPTITNLTGDLTGTVNSTTYLDPVIVYSPTYTNMHEYVYQYKIDNGYIITNFEEGFLELSYKAFVTDDHGFPMIPDDQRYIDAIRWAIIEHLDYKKWRVGEITDKVYQKSERELAWYLASARSKADIPSPQKMEALKNMFLRTITKVREADTYFKYSNIGEIRYTHTDK